MSLRHLYFDEGTEKLPKTSIICLYMAQMIAPPKKHFNALILVKTLQLY